MPLVDVVKTVGPAGEGMMRFEQTTVGIGGAEQFACGQVKKIVEGPRLLAALGLEDIGRRNPGLSELDELSVVQAVLTRVTEH